MTPNYRNDLVLAGCLAFVVVMVAAAYAAVPLYYLICRSTGYGGTPVRAAHAPAHSADRVITVRFDTNVDPGLAWTFQPVDRTVQVHVGETKLVYFKAVNNDRIPITGHATFNVEPDQVASYFDKLQCFCFTEQTLAPGETVEMPVIFFIDPAILKDRDVTDINDITLSYTFFSSVNQKTAAATSRANVLK
jgi:cytochrome c oxidase assembly protein subunit 11